MQHSIYGRKLNRTANERKRLFKNLIRSLILNGQIQTTLAKAKAIQPSIEKLVTKAKVGDTILTKRILMSEISDQNSVNKLLEIGKLFKERKGGYTRILKLGNRLGDNATSVVMSFTTIVGNSAIVVKPVKKVEVINAKDKTKKTK